MARILPIVIGDFIPEADPYWENYLMRIADLLFANKLHEDAVGYMANLIHLHHTRFKQLYQESPSYQKCTHGAHAKIDTTVSPFVLR